MAGSHEKQSDSWRKADAKRPLELGVLPVQQPSSQADNYLVWAQLALVTTVTKHLIGFQPYPRAGEERSGKSSCSPGRGCQGDPSQRARVSPWAGTVANQRLGKELG